MRPKLFYIIIQNWQSYRNHYSNHYLPFSPHFIITKPELSSSIPFISIFTGFKCQVVTSIFPSLTTEGNIETTRFLVIFCYFITIFVVISVFIFTVEEGEAKGMYLCYRSKVSSKKFGSFVFFLTTDFPVNFKFITSTAEVIFTKFNDTHQTIRFRSNQHLM